MHPNFARIARNLPQPKLRKTLRETLAQGKPQHSERGTKPGSVHTLYYVLTLSRTDWHLGCERSRSPSADRPVRGRCSPARHQLKPTLGRAIDWHCCSLPQRVQLSRRPPASCLQVAERRRSCPALDGGGQLWLEEGGRFEAAVARVSFRGCQHAARSPVPCLVRRLPVTCSSSRRVLTPW